MSYKLTRRRFLNKSLVASMTAASTNTLSAANMNTATPAKKSSADDLPLGKIGDVSVSRLIVGGNPISGNAHSRDLPYVSSLMRRYFKIGRAHV